MGLADQAVALANTQTDSCVEWPAALTGDGYGRLNLNRAGKRYRLRGHRYVWMRCRGWMHGLHVLHSCDNPKCINLRHLRLGTDADNHREKVVKGRWQGRRSMRVSKDVIDQIRSLYRGDCRPFKSDSPSPHLTQQQIADRFGVSNQYVSEVVRGLVRTSR